MGAEVFLRGLLRGFYSSREINSVPDVSMREFGIGDFGRKISARHLSFRSHAEMNSFLREKAPFYISYSCARYELPSARPMEAKRMLGADLIYEFDADELPTDCKKSHDSWKCRSESCGASGAGRALRCSKCGSAADVEEWVCPECLGEAKRQSLRLISFLQDDFGLSGGIAVNFSGSKGFHIHVRSGEVQGLSRSARLELLDYLTATGLDMDSLGFSYVAGRGKENRESGFFVCPKKSGASGWAKRILAEFERVFESGDASRLGLMGGIRESSAKKLLKEKHRILSHMDKGLLAFSTKEVPTNRFWKSCMACIVADLKVEPTLRKTNMDTLEVDRQTSVDINKIVRVPGTIHGSTGLLAEEVAVDGLKGFAPLDECLALPSGDVSLASAVAPRFYLGGKFFGPFGGEGAVLPAFAAFYLLARGSASLSGVSGSGVAVPGGV